MTLGLENNIKGSLGFSLFIYVIFFFNTYESVQLKWTISFLTTNKKQSLAKQKSMISYHDSVFLGQPMIESKKKAKRGSCVTLVCFVLCHQIN